MQLLPLQLLPETNLRTMNKIFILLFVALPSIGIGQQNHNMGWKFHWDSSWLLHSSGQKAVNPGAGMIIYDQIQVNDQNYLTLNAGIKYYSITSKYYAAFINDSLNFFDLTGLVPSYGKIGITSADFSVGYKKTFESAEKRRIPGIEGGVTLVYNFYAYSWKRGSDPLILGGYRKLLPVVYSEFSFNGNDENEKLINKFGLRVSFSLLPFFKENNPVNYPFLSFGFSIGF